MKSTKFHFCSFLLQFALLSASLAHSSSGQTTTAPASSTPVERNGVDSLALLSTISAKTGIPAACISRLKMVRDTKNQVERKDALRRVIDFNDDQLCSLYLVLSSQQYQRASKAARGQLLGLWLPDTAAKQAVINDVIKDYKTLSQQTGASSGTGGTTNLVSKGAAAKMFSFANEYGAVTESTSGQTTTVTGTLAGVPLVLLKSGIVQECSVQIYSLFSCVHAPVVDYLGRISYSIAFDTSTSGQTVTGTPATGTSSTAIPATFTASTHNINAITAKWIAIQGKPSTPDIQAAVKNFVTTTTVAAQAVTLVQFFDSLEVTAPKFLTWQDNSINSLSDAMQKDIDADQARGQSMSTTQRNRASETLINTTNAFKALGTGFVEALGLPQDATGEVAAQSPIITNAVSFAVVYARYLGQEEAISAGIARPAVLSFEYDDNRPVSQPSNSVFRVIYQAKIKSITLTANGAASIYDSTPSASVPGASRLRDVQFAFGADRDFSPNLPVAGKIGMTASGNFYFQNQQSPAILNITPGTPVNGITFTGLPSTATQVFAQKGNIGVGQLKLTVGSGANIKVPFSVTYSNRTELVTSPVWRGQVGISYDFDSLFQSKK
jgi:hypothetical protein